MYKMRNLFWALLLLACSLIPRAANAWEWSDLVGGSLSSAQQTLSIEEVSNLRVRDIKRRLTRNHGFSAEEVGRMLDKKELVHALAFEEEKVRLAAEAAMKRALLKQGIVAAVIAVLVVMCWPLLQHAYEVVSINFVVYTDRKRHEATRCWELQSIKAMIGVAFMFLLDLLQVWLTGSILLSWVMTSRYFFPVPSLPIRPAQLMGGEVGRSSLASYGINVGPMVIAWIMRFIYARIEAWTGRAMASAHRAQRQAARELETAEEKVARKASRKEAKRRAAERQQAAAAARASAPTSLPTDWMQPIEDSATSGVGVESSAGPEGVVSSSAHQEFLEQLDTYTSELDDLD